MDPLNNLPVKDILSASAPIISSFIEKVVAPKLLAFKNQAVTAYQKTFVLTSHHFSEYLSRTYKNAEIVNTVAFSNGQRLLKDVYLPLTLISKKAPFTKVKLDLYPTTLMETHQRILITDAAGMGKSTISKRLFLDIIDRKLGIPIYVELRKLNKTNKLLNEIHGQLNSIGKNFDQVLLIELMQDGEFIFLLDGYDEIPLADRTEITQNIQNFISHTSKNKFILTSRPENAINSFGDFQEFSIQGMSKAEAFNLLGNYDNHGDTSRALIEKLEDENTIEYVKEFLTNPLLVTLLFTGFDYKRSIPFQKHNFYRQVFDAYFDRHDVTKGDFTHQKYCGLGSDDFHRILRHLGFTFMRNQVSEYNKDQMLHFLKDSSFFYGLNVSESELLKDLLTTVPLFIQDGNFYKWAHKSLQEYFAAMFIHSDAKSEQENILINIYDHPNLEKFLNVLELFSYIDRQAFTNTIVHRHLKDFQKHIAETTFMQGYQSKGDIDLRKEAMFLNQCYFCVIPIKSETEDEGKIADMLRAIHHAANKSGKLEKGATTHDEFVRYRVYVYSHQKRSINKIIMLHYPEVAKVPVGKLSCTPFGYHSQNKLPKLLFENVLEGQRQFYNGLNFENTTDMIISATRNFPIIDSGKAFSFLKSIEAEKSRDFSNLSSF